MRTPLRWSINAERREQVKDNGTTHHAKGYKRAEELTAGHETRGFSQRKDQR